VPNPALSRIMKKTGYSGHQHTGIYLEGIQSDLTTDDRGHFQQESEQISGL